MREVSKQFREDAKIRRDFYVTAECTLSDGTSLMLEKKDFYMGGNGIVDSSDSADFPLGVAVEKTATLCLVNDDDRFSEYNFNAARFVLFLNFDLSTGTTEQIRLGTYIVNKKPATSGKINLTLTDRMHYADKQYSTELIFPTTAFEVLKDSCETCGIQLGDAVIPNGDYIVNEIPDNTTHRAVIGCVAMIAGGNARIDESDKLRIIGFNRSALGDDIYDGGTFRPWTKGEEIDGGTFNPWTVGTVIDGGTFKQMEEYHVFYRIKGLQVDTDDVVVTGVKTSIDKTGYLYGTDDYAIVIDNMLIAGNEQDALHRIGDAVIGLTMRPFSCQHIAYPMVTFLDPAYIVDDKNRVYQTYITCAEFTFNGYTYIANMAKSAVEEETEFYSPDFVAVEQAKKETEKKLDQYDIAVRNMNELAANTFGYFSTSIDADNGGKITYWHNKPKLEDSKIVYKMGIEGFFVTRDFQGSDEATSLAGKWKAGFDSEGNAELNILYAIGIAAEWINTRGLTAKDNDDNVTLHVDPETGAVDIVAKSFSLSSGETIESIAESKANEKSRTFRTQPVPPYNAGDLWYGGEDKDVLVCKTSRKSGNFNTEDWEKEDRYIDKKTAETVSSTAVDNMTQTDVLNKLTRNGEDNGIYMQDGKLYISFSAMRGEELTLGGVNNSHGIIRILDAEGKECGVIDNNGIFLYSEETGIQILLSPLIGLVQRDAEGNEFNGLFYTKTVNLPSKGQNSKTTIYHSYDEDDFKFISSVLDPSNYSRFINTYGWAHKTAYWSPVHSYKYPVSSAYISSLTVQLPNSFKEKRWARCDVSYTGHKDINELGYTPMCNWSYDKAEKVYCYEDCRIEYSAGSGILLPSSLDDDAKKVFDGTMTQDAFKAKYLYLYDIKFSGQRKISPYVPAAPSHDSGSYDATSEIVMDDYKTQLLRATPNEKEGTVVVSGLGNAGNWLLSELANIKLTVVC